MVQGSGSGFAFQSHAGSIEACPKKISTPPAWICFNPTLVRLRHDGIHTPSIALWPCFNPTLVRLRLPPPVEQPLKPPVFQSHAGSIEADTKEESRGRTIKVSIPRWFD